MPETAKPDHIGAYEVVRERGETSAAVLYEAVKPAQGRPVTIAMLTEQVAPDEARVRAFWDEAMKLGELRHPNVARVIDQGRHGDSLYLVEEHVAGAPLAQLMKQRRLSLAQALTVFKALCSALEAAHEKGIIHHDVTPAQVMVSEDLTVIKLRGFGLRQFTQARADGTTMATTRTVYAGLSYMSPEQAKSIGLTDARSNVYSIGVILYELLTGRVPRGRFQLPSQLNPEVPSEVDALVLKCVATKPEERFTSAAEIKRRLATLEDQLRLGLLHELQGLQRSTAKMLRRQDETDAPVIAEAAVAGPAAAAANRMPLWIAIGVAVLLAIAVVVLALTR